MTDEKCVFYGEPKSCGHLFFMCRYTNKIWRKLLDWMHIVHSPKEWKAELNWIIEATKGKSCRAKLLKICIAKMTYHAWLMRNRRVFQNNDDQELYFRVIKGMIFEHAH